MVIEESAAHNLEGKVLGSGWEVFEKINKPANSTGSFFSVCYKARKNGQVCFLKAFDFAKFQQLADIENAGRSMVDVMGDMIKAYQYERDLSDHCRDRYVTKVSFVLEAGEENLREYTYSLVPYLVFDLADGDVRRQLQFSEKLDFAWKLSSLHDVTVGLRQLHNIEVSHQDIKPSNILVFNKTSKIGDLGRSLCKSLDNPYEGYVFTGDHNHAPPEIMYQYYSNDWNTRVFATDCYLLGSLIVFYFSGISMTALLMKNIPNNFRVEKWRGHYSDVITYIMDSFYNSLEEFTDSIPYSEFKNELRLIVEQLCFPIPDERGHPKNIASKASSYSLERYISVFDRLHKKAEYIIKNT